MEKQEIDVLNNQTHVYEVCWESTNLLTLVIQGKVRLEENMQSAQIQKFKSNTSVLCVNIWKLFALLGQDNWGHIPKFPGMGTTIFPSQNGPNWLWNPY